MTVGAVDDFDTVFSAHAEVVPYRLISHSILARYSPRTRR